MSVRRSAIFVLLMVVAVLPPSLMAAKKSLRVGIDQDYPPFEYLNEKGQPSGFDYEVALSVLRVLDIEAKFLHGNWSQINRMLKDGEVDLLAGVYLNPGREDEYEFSLPYIITSHALFYTQSSQLQTLADIKNAPRPKVIVQNNPHITQYILKLNPKARLVFGHSAADCMRLLAADSGSIAIAPEQVGLYYIRKLGLSNVLVTDVRLLPREYSFATRKGDTLLIQLINHGLNLIQKTGEYDVIREKWLINEKGREFPVVLIWIAGLIIGFLLFILLIYFFWNRQLKRRVSEKTRELNLKLIEKERAEQQLTIEKERAEESDRLKSAFLANMSHEIRTPMNAIIGFSELMADEKISNPERKAFYDLVNTNSQILLNLINDIIDIAKIEAKQLEVNREPVRVNTLLNTLFDTYKLELRIRRKEHLSLELELPADDNLFVIADEFRLGQVFQIWLSIQLNLPIRVMCA